MGKIYLHSVQNPSWLRPMPFAQMLKTWTPFAIAQRLGCPERTAYAWKRGERTPPPWVQRLIAAELKRRKPSA